MNVCKTDTWRMNQRAQAVVIGLWILVILTILALSIGHQVSLSLKMSVYFRDRVKASFLAKAAVNRAVAEILQDRTQGYDALSDNWADNKDAFEKIIIDGHQDEFGSVSYPATEDDRGEIHYGVIDEARKININTATKELLTALFIRCGIEAAEEAANNVLIWRGDIPDTEKIYESIGYPCKAKKLKYICELMLVKGLTSQDYQKLKEWVTVYGDGAININTVSGDILTLVAESLARKLSIGTDVAQGLVAKIIDSRDNKGFFKDKDDLEIILVGDDEINLYNNLINLLTFESTYFLIQATGHANKIKIRLSVVYNRKGQNIQYAHEG